MSPVSGGKSGNNTEAVIETIVGALEHRLSAKPAPAPPAPPCNLSKLLKEQADLEAKGKAEPAKAPGQLQVTTPPASTSVEMLRSGDMLIKRGNEVEVVKAEKPNATTSDSTTKPYPAQSMLETRSALSDIHQVQP